MKERKRDFSIIAIICIIITTLFTSYKYSEIIAADVYMAETETTVFQELDIILEEDELPEQTVLLKAYISGEVLLPGVYELNEGARAADLLDMAGGVLESGDLSKINLAAYVSDAQHIYVPALGEEEQEEQAADEENDGTIAEMGPVNINTASLKRLTSLPGIGEVIGQNIIAYREANGEFNSKEEIKNVSRIGEKLYEQIKELITID